LNGNSSVEAKQVSVLYTNPIEEKNENIPRELFLEKLEKEKG
jgi:hypothetical protein